MDGTEMDAQWIFRVKWSFCSLFCAEDVFILSFLYRNTCEKISICDGGQRDEMSSCVEAVVRREEKREIISKEGEESDIFILYLSAEV